MYKLTFILALLTFAACNNQRSSASNSVKYPKKPKSAFEVYFADLDTSKAGQSIGCLGTVYKCINDNYLVCISPPKPVRFDSCYTISIDSLNGKQLTELLVFDHKNASLSNVCTDIKTINTPSWTRKLHTISGQLVVGFSDLTELYGDQKYRTTVLIKKLIFIDSKTGKKIELENELLWKVVDLETPG